MTLDAKGSRLTVRHKMTNRGYWSVELAPWAITIMRYGGTTILPQEPFRSHDEYLLPARPMTLWHYTDLSDPRWTLGRKFIRLRTDDTMEAPQKIGIANKQGWAGYLRNQMLFLKRVHIGKALDYPDYGSNVETYTAGPLWNWKRWGRLNACNPARRQNTLSFGRYTPTWKSERVKSALEAALAPIIRE